MMSLRELKCMLEKSKCMTPLLWLCIGLKRLSEKIYRHIIGRIVLRKLIAGKSDNEIYIMLGRGIGDTLYALAYIETFIASQPEKQIIIIGDKKYDKLLQTYVVNKRIILKLISRPELDRLHTYHFNRKHLWKAVNNGIFDIPAMAWCFEGEDTITKIRKDVFHFPDNTPISYHKLKKEQVISIKDFDKNKNRIVVINPYSGSMDWDNKSIPLFEAMSQQLQQMGFIVYTNISDHAKNNATIKNTIPLACSIYELYSIVCEIPLIVSIRSGICDLLAPSGINMFVLYLSDDIFYKTFTLRAWECSGNIRELCGELQYLEGSAQHALKNFLDELKAEGRLS